MTAEHTTALDAIHDAVRARYAAAAQAAAAGRSACCGPATAPANTAVLRVVANSRRTDIARPDEPFGAGRYDTTDRSHLPDAAVAASLGCGNPIAVADLHPGETVLDLGSGGGIDVLLSARRVGPTGTAYGLDMTDDMLDLARRDSDPYLLICRLPRSVWGRSS